MTYRKRKSVLEAILVVAGGLGMTLLLIGEQNIMPLVMVLVVVQIFCLIFLDWSSEAEREAEREANQAPVPKPKR